MQKLWSLYNRDEKLRIDDLKPEQVKIILLAIPTAKMESWFACQESDLHWQPISAIPEFYEDVRQIKGAAETTVKLVAGGDFIPDENESVKSPTKKPSGRPQILKRRAADQAESPSPEPSPIKPLPPRRPMFEDAPTTQEKTASIMVENVSTRERRSARRFMRRLEFQIEIGSESFQCETSDISMSGMSLTQPLPDWAGKSFRAELHCNGETIGIFCARVTDKKLRILEADSWELVRKWIVSW